MCLGEDSAAASAEALLRGLDQESTEVYQLDDATAVVYLDQPANPTARADLRRRIRQIDSAASMSEQSSRLDPVEQQLVVHVYDRRERWRRWFLRLLMFGLLLFSLAFVGLSGSLWAAGYHDVRAETLLRMERARAHVLGHLAHAHTQLQGER